MEQSPSSQPQEQQELPAWFHPLRRDKLTREILKQRGVPTFSRWLAWYALRADYETALALPVPEPPSPETLAPIVTVWHIVYALDANKEE